jgi:hypothetical protein
MGPRGPSIIIGIMIGMTVLREKLVMSRGQAKSASPAPVLPNIFGPLTVVRERLLPGAAAAVGARFCPRVSMFKVRVMLVNFGSYLD